MMNEKWKSAFDQIHAEEALKDHTKEYLSEKIYNRRSASHPVFRRAAVLAAGLVLLFFIGGTWIFMTPADCRAKRTPVPYSADSLRHN